MGLPEMEEECAAPLQPHRYGLAWNFELWLSYLSRKLEDLELKGALRHKEG